MNGLTTALLSRACRTFLTLAYPQGEHTIPEPKRPYLRLDPGLPLESVLPPARAAQGICQPIKGEGGGVRGYAFRLGSATFPHLKLQVIDYDHGTALVFAVDTHDALPRALADPSHPDFDRWTEMQRSNRQLKEQIERAWEREGLCTFNRLLRMDLDNPPEPAPVPSA